MVVSSCEKMSSELSLTWDDHHSTLVGVFEELLETNTLVDCTIAAEGQYLKAHKIILSACSPYFQLLFSQENEKNPIVVLKDIKFQELKAMIDFIYRGKVKVPEERLGEFVDAAESLQIKGLGGDNRQKMSPQNIGNKGQYIQRRRSMMSALPRKRLRRTDFSDGDRGDTIPQNEGNFENKSFEGPSCEIHVEAPRSCHDETTLTLSSTTNSPTSLPSSISSEMRNLETTESVSFVKPPASPCDEVLPNPESVVVKSEPEAMAEVYIPETDCYIEPKEEDIAEDEELEETEGETSSELATDQFPAFSAMPQATSIRPETDFVPQMPETSSSMGAVAAFVCAPAGVGRPLQSIASSPSKAFARRQGTSESSVASFIPRAVTGAPPPSTSAYCPTEASSIYKKKKTRRHVCTVCAKAFTSKEKLVGHFRIHTGERPFACETCGKTFTQSGNLRIHSMIHTGFRPFGCELCDKAYSQKANLLIHIRRHHANWGRSAASGAGRP